MSESKRNLPGKGLFGWLGRQIGYVSAAVKHDVEVVAKREQQEEREDPDHPDYVFRRTTIDEVRRKPRELEGKGGDET